MRTVIESAVRYIMPEATEELIETKFEPETFSGACCVRGVSDNSVEFKCPNTIGISAGIDELNAETVDRIIDKLKHSIH